MDYRIENIRKIDKGVLRASFDLVVGPFTIKDFLLFEKNGEYWVSSPARQYEQDGEKKYFNYVRCESKEKWDSFANWAIDILQDEIGSDAPTQQHGPEDDDIPF